MRRLGIDVGTNSIGWCLIEEDEKTKVRCIIDIGVRIFSDGRDPKSGASLAVDRRTARGMRRRRDRFLGRRSAFFETLIKYGLMPADADEAKMLAQRDPYQLRARALDEALHPYEIGRALFHLNQRRGFKSNRKAERRQKDNKPGVVESGARELDQAMAESGAETLGQFLNGRPIKRVRLDSDAQGYDFYPQRRHYEYEFDRIWETQARHHPAVLTDEARVALHRVLFHQRPLKEPEVGLCLFAGRNGVPETERRLPKAHPLFQERRLYEEVNHLQITTPGEAPRPLTADERKTLLLRLMDKREVAFASLAKLLKLEEGQNFNKASEARTHLAGNEVRAIMSDKSRFDSDWHHLSPTRQWEIIEHVIEEENPQALHAFLTRECGLDEEHAVAVAKAPLPEGHGRIGETASRAILEELKKDDLPTYAKAVERAGWHHSDERTGEALDKLPYYGELLSRQIPPGSFDPKDLDGDKRTRKIEQYWGKITNPTVHIGLRQLEKLVNAVIAVHGLPDEIVVELARELKLNEKEKEAHNRRIRQDTVAARLRSDKLRGTDADGNQIGDAIADDTGANRARLKLWEELNPSNPLDRRCPYCGDPRRAIGIQQLFSNEIDVDHIIPYSRSLDDSAANKVVAHRSCNREKGNRTPFERWGIGNDPERWDRIATQVARLHRSKQWRFGPDAMARFEGEKNFIARQLTDTQHLSRLARTYLSSLYPSKEDGRVYVIPGRMTAMLRRLWALNGILDQPSAADDNEKPIKNRDDHRHHAIDAFVCAVTSTSLLQKIAHAAARAEEKELDRKFEDLPEPWPGYLPELKARLSAVTTSHKPDHGRKGRPPKGRDSTAGRLHNDTAYGFTGLTASDGKTPIVVHRVPLTSLKPEHLTDADRIPDQVLRDGLYAATRGLSGKAFEAELRRIQKDGLYQADRNGRPLFQGLRHIRVREPLNVIPIRDKQGRAYKGYKGDSNARYDVWQLPGGKWVTKWTDRDGKEQSGVVSMFDAHQPAAAERRPHPAAKKVLSLRQDDVIAVGTGDARRLLRVAGFNAGGRLTLAPTNDGGKLKERDAAPDDSFKYTYLSAGSLKTNGARQVRLDPLGRVFDPGPRD